LYTAPSGSPPSPNPAVVKVASSADPGKNKTANVTVTGGGPTVVVVPGSGGNATGINFVISTSTPTLGIADIGPCNGVGCSAGVGSVTIAKGASMNVWVLGQGLTTGGGAALASGLAVSISHGSTTDVTVGTLLPNPDVAGLKNIFAPLTVSAGAASGPRNLIVTNAAGEMAVYVGAIIIP